MLRGGATRNISVAVAVVVAVIVTPAVAPARPDRSREPEPWRVLSDAPLNLTNHTAVWTGRAVMLWGGVNEGFVPGAGPYREGGMGYDPDSGHWHRLPAAPILGRGHHGAVWTGQEMVVWGGFAGDENGARTGGRNETDARTAGGNEPGPRADGAVYEPATRTWRVLPAGPLSGRYDPVMVWTGREVLVWGGRPSGSFRSALADGALFDPGTGRWRSTAPAPFAVGGGGGWPVGRGMSSRVLVWGWLPGEIDPDRHLARAALYDPVHDTWRAVPGAWSAKMDPAWTGDELVVPNLHPSDPPRQGGKPILHGAYDPAADRWRRITPGPNPMTFEEGSFAGDLAVWTGREALFWGDHADAYDPARDRWRRMAQAPKDCRAAPAVWTGSEMVVWGGEHGGSGYYTFNDGLAYRPAADHDPPPPSTTTTTGDYYGQPFQYRCGGS